MDTEYAKEIWGNVQSQWMKLPQTERGPGSKKAIAHAMWLKTDRVVPFDRWFGDMLKAANKTTKPISPSQNSVRSRYRAMAMTKDILPPDYVLRDVWECAGDSTLSSTRSFLKKEGFDFVVEDGIVKVTRRPAKRLDQMTREERQKEIAEAEAIFGESSLPPSLPSNIQPQCNIDALRQDIARQNILIAEAVDRLEARINEVAQINAEIVQIMREVWQS